MGLITGLLTLPLAPVRGVMWIAEQIQREAERQWSDPDVLRAQLADVQADRDRGILDEAEADRLEDELVRSLLQLERQSPTSEGWR
jgi:cytochrome c-type biogenesis protein CcmI